MPYSIVYMSADIADVFAIAFFFISDNGMNLNEAELMQ